MTSPASADTAQRLPDLRQDVRLFRGPGSTHHQTWLLYDPVRHRYFQISNEAYSLLALWRRESIDDFAAQASRALEREVPIAEIQELATFIVSANLTTDPPGSDPRAYARQELGAHRALIWRVIHNYLFFKIPIVRPERFLEKTLPLVAPLYTRSTAAAIMLISLIGLYFTSRQWDQFAVTFLDFVSLEGAVVYGLSLIAIKTLHELGHAYTATRLGVRVNTMGIAFMVLMPILYTDVTDAWRVRERRHKLAIDAAGIIVEIAIAGLSLFLWAFLPDGPMRSAAFAAATTSLALGLLVNLNPLMRFDGYHILADAWNFPNLDSRSRSMAVWWLRNALFGLGDPPPEKFPGRQRRALIFYAIAAWLYRQALFLGIALAVYHMFFKVLGVVLFLVEIIWFILLPAMREIREWWKMRSRIIQTRRTMITISIAGLVALLLFIPWSGTIALQAVLIAPSETVIFAPRPAQVKAAHLHNGASIKKGTLLLELASPDLNRQLAQAQLETKLTRLRLERIVGDEADRSRRTVLERELLRNLSRISALEAEIRRLTVRAPFDGLLRDVDPDLQPGEWLDATSPIARVVAIGSPVGTGYLDEGQIWRIRAGAPAVFVPEDTLMASISGHVTDRAMTGSHSIDIAYLASVYGGAVPSDKAPDGEIRPRSGKHVIRVAFDAPPISRVSRGTLRLVGEKESFASMLWRQVLKVLVRESTA